MIITLLNLSRKTWTQEVDFQNSKKPICIYNVDIAVDMISICLNT